MTDLVSQEISIVNQERDSWTEDRIALVKRMYCNGATDDQLALFISTCKKLGLSPEARQIYAVLRFDKKSNSYVMGIQTSIDGFRLAAERTGKYGGQTESQWCGPDGVWKTVWTSTTTAPVAARVGVYRTDWKHPLYAVARYKSFVQKVQGKVTFMWSQMDDLMLAKCAESQALRKAFPMELSGLYTVEEMQQPDKVINAEPTQAVHQIKSADPEPYNNVDYDKIDKLLEAFSTLPDAEPSDPIRYTLEAYCGGRDVEEFTGEDFAFLRQKFKEIKDGSLRLRDFINDVTPQEPLAENSSNEKSPEQATIDDLESAWA